MAVVTNDTVAHLRGYGVRTFGGSAYAANAQDLNGDGRTDPCLSEPAAGRRYALLSSLDYALVAW